MKEVVAKRTRGGTARRQARLGLSVVVGVVSLVVVDDGLFVVAANVSSVGPGETVHAGDKRVLSRRERDDIVLGDAAYAHDVTVSLEQAEQASVSLSDASQDVDANAIAERVRKVDGLECALGRNLEYLASLADDLELVALGEPGVGRTASEALLGRRRRGPADRLGTPSAGSIPHAPRRVAAGRRRLSLPRRSVGDDGHVVERLVVHKRELLRVTRQEAAQAAEHRLDRLITFRVLGDERGTQICRPAPISENYKTR